LWAVDVAQRFVLERIASALTTSDLGVVLQGSGDLTIAGRKFGGTAQRRLRAWFLVHCSILYDFPLERVGRYLLLPSRQPAYRGGRSHEEFLRNLDSPRRIVIASIRSAWSPSRSLSPTTDVPHQLVQILLAERFASRSWIERL
jgi:lipoate-protein ligase A